MKKIDRKEIKIEEMKKSIGISLGILLVAAKEDSRYEKVLDFAIFILSKLQGKLLKTSHIVQEEIEEGQQIQYFLYNNKFTNDPELRKSK